MFGSYRHFYIYEPKKRKISAAPFRDRVVHHALCNVIEPIFKLKRRERGSSCYAVPAHVVYFDQWIDGGAGGYAGVEAGFVLARDPDTVRAPDVAYVAAERVPAAGVPEGFWPTAPDLAVEIISPSETADEVRDKIRDYLQAGTRTVWVVYPRSREVLAYTPDGRAQTFGSTMLLEDPLVVPGFSCAVSSLFQ